jgi:hypothetical protein
MPNSASFGGQGIRANTGVSLRLDQTHGRDARATWHGRLAHVWENLNAKRYWYNGQTAQNMNESSSSVRIGIRGQFRSFPSAVLSSQFRKGGLAFSLHIRRTADDTAFDSQRTIAATVKTMKYAG